MKGVFCLTELGFKKISNISFDDIFNLLFTCVGILEQNNFNEKDELIQALKNVKFQHLSKGKVYEDNNDCKEYIIPYDCIRMEYDYDIASAFDKFTIANSPHREGYIEIIALAQMLGALCGHYRIREWGGANLFFIA
jgi:hypothetical protein